MISWDFFFAEIRQPPCGAERLEEGHPSNPADPLLGKSFVGKRVGFTPTLTLPQAPPVSPRGELMSLIGFWAVLRCSQRLPKIIPKNVLFFGCILGAKMSPAGSQKTPKVDPKTNTHHLKFQVSFRLHFFTILNDPDPPFWRSRVHEKLFFQFLPCRGKHLKTVKKGFQKGAPGRSKRL